MLIAIIHNQGDPLAATLTSIQPQLAETDDIYVIDRTPDREGWNLVKKYGTSRSTIYTEVGSFDRAKCEEIFKERAIQNKHIGILFLENVLVATTFIANLKKAISMSEYSILSPEILFNRDILNPNFSWYNPPTRFVSMCNDYTERIYWLSMDIGSGVGLFDNEKVVLL